MQPNPERLLLALDECLDHEVSLVLYGRGGIWMGFEGAPSGVAYTKDIDGIIRLNQLDALVADSGFWDAKDAVNARFENEKLYITHLFQEDQVFLRRNWEAYLVPVTKIKFRHLKLSRPAGLDFILTKMMRGDDEQDMADAAFIIKHDHITKAQLLQAFSEINPIDLIELQDAFDRARPVVLKMAFD